MFLKKFEVAIFSSAMDITWDFVNGGWRDWLGTFPDYKISSGMREKFYKLKIRIVVTTSVCL